MQDNFIIFCVCYILSFAIAYHAVADVHVKSLTKTLGSRCVLLEVLKHTMAEL